MNESLSDVWGSLVKQYKLHQDAAAADWLIGSEVWTPNISADALRSMKSPGDAYDDPLVGKDPQPAHMDQYVETVQDNGGVHINSGIPNHAFYLAATEIGGFAWEVTGRIWYEALQHPALRPDSGFLGLRAPDDRHRRARARPRQHPGPHDQGRVGQCRRPDRATCAALANCALS